MKTLLRVGIYGGLSVSIVRAVSLLMFGLNLGWMAVAIGFAIALGVAEGASFLRHKETRKVAILVLLACYGMDTWLNQLEVVRNLQMGEIAQFKNFLGVPANWLSAAMEVTGFMIGFGPTLVTALFSLLSSCADKVQKDDALDRFFAGFRIVNFFRIGAVAASGVEYAPQNSKSEKLPQPAKPDRKVAAKTWGKELSSDDLDRILMASRKEVARFFGVSDGTAKNWKAAAKEGRKPWRDPLFGEWRVAEGKLLQEVKDERK